jgi:hypothetical protein
LPRGTRIDAPEVLGGTIKVWRVDAHDLSDPDEIRAVVIEDRDPETPVASWIQANWTQ